MNQVVVRRLREPEGKVHVWVDGDSMETKPRLNGEPDVLIFAKDDTRALGAVGVREGGPARATRSRREGRGGLARARVPSRSGRGSGNHAAPFLVAKDVQ